MKKNRIILSLIYCLCIVTSTHAEVSINSLHYQNVQEMLLEQFIGSGVEISNATFNGEEFIPSTEGSQIASFNNDPTCDLLDIQNGILLSTANLKETILDCKEFALGDIDLSYEDLYDFANAYIPYLLKKEYTENYSNVQLYNQYVSNRGANHDLWLSHSDLINAIKEDKLIAYAEQFWDSNRRSYKSEYNFYSYIKDIDTYETYYQYYAIYKVVNSLDPKYYNNDLEIVSNLTKLRNNSEFQKLFASYYVHNTAGLEYNKANEDIYKKILEPSLYDNTMNIYEDEDLRIKYGDKIFSPAILEFDFSSPNDSIKFEYAFASQEYPEYVGSAYNDVFVLYLKDLTTGTQTNIASIPETNAYVSINNLNDTYNSTYFIKNYECMKSAGNCGCNLSYGGFTKTMVAKAKVVPCRKYHIKIVVANIADFMLQSAVFLKGGSFNSSGVSSTIKYTKADADGISHDCSNGEIVIKINKSSSPTNLYVKHIGEAKNGIHYERIPEKLVIPANTDSFKVDLIALPIETDSMEVAIVITPESDCSDVSDTIRTYIHNNSPFSITPYEAECCATELSVETTGFIKNIKWEPAELLSDNNKNVVHPKDCPTKEVNYTITASNKFGCRVEESEITVIPCDYDLSFDVKLTTENGSDELIENCNEGELEINVFRGLFNSNDL